MPVNTPTSQIEYVPRRFSLGDALILMIALSISLERFRAIHFFQSLPRTISWCWHVILQLAGLAPWAGFGTVSKTRAEVWLDLFANLDELILRTMCPVLVGLMVAQPMLRLRHPRPPMSAVARQSGFVICMMGIALVCLLLPIGDMWFSGFALNLGLTRAFILLMIWPLLGLRPWCTERSWIDRLGRSIGLGWVVAIALGALLEQMGLI
jgi:hypothetical protein